MKSSILKVRAKILKLILPSNTREAIQKIFYHLLIMSVQKMVEHMKQVQKLS